MDSNRSGNSALARWSEGSYSPAYDSLKRILCTNLLLRTLAEAVHFPARNERGDTARSIALSSVGQVICELLKISLEALAMNDTWFAKQTGMIHGWITRRKCRASKCFCAASGIPFLRKEDGTSRTQKDLRIRTVRQGSVRIARVFDPSAVYLKTD